MGLQESEMQINEAVKHTFTITAAIQGDHQSKDDYQQAQQQNLK